MTRRVPFFLRSLALLPLLFGIAGCGALAFFNAAVPKDWGARLAARDVAYGPDPRQKLDVYVPTGDAGEPRKLVVFLYGGSWTGGRRQDYAFVGRALAAEGFVAVLPDYRLVPAVRYPAFLEDNAAALAWAYRHAGEFGGDAGGVFLAGHSAGAYGAVMLAVAPEFLRAQGLSTGIVRGVAALSGPYEFVPLDVPETRAAFAGVENLGRTQPIGRLSRALPVPPMLLAHGLADDFVKPSNARNLAAALGTSGHDAELKLYEGVSHRGTLLSLALPFRGQAPVLEDVVSFIRRH